MESYGSIPKINDSPSTPNVPNAEQNENDEEDRSILSENQSIQENAEREGQMLMSPTRALMGLLKSMVGPGCLSLPYGWKQGGLWVSFGSSIFISLMNLYCSLQMIYTAQHLCKV